MDNHRPISWHELRLTVPPDAIVKQYEQPHIAVSSLRIYGPESPLHSNPTFSITAARQALSPGATLERWAASIVDLAGDRRVRIQRRVGSHDLVLAVPATGDPIGTFIFAVVNRHGFNIMTDAAADPRSQEEIAAIIESIRFEEGSA
jgi:hypothetical protein